jgi:hypothetical protein
MKHWFFIEQMNHLFMNKCDRILSHKTKKIGSVTLIFNAKVKVASLKRKLKEHFQM